MSTRRLYNISQVRERKRKMKSLNIAKKTFNLIGGGVVSVVTVYGMKEVLNLMFQSDETLEQIRALFSDSSNAATIQIEEEDHTITAYSEYIHLDGTITVSSDATMNTYTIQLFRDDSTTIQNQLSEAKQKIENLSEKLDVTQAALNDLLKNQKEG